MRVWFAVLVASVFILISLYLALDAYSALTLILIVKDPAKRERLHYELSRRVWWVKNFPQFRISNISFIHYNSGDITYELV